MKTMYIWGAGKYLNLIYEAINKEMCYVAGIIDNDERKQGEVRIKNIKIMSPDVLQESKFDYILVAAKNYQAILDECQYMEIEQEKIIVFWTMEKESLYVDYKVKRILDLEAEVKKYKWRLENLPYELGAKSSPIVKSSEELIDALIEKRASLCRFGDGEFELMREKERLWYQSVNEKLAMRLYEVLNSEQPNIIIAIANNFGNLDCYTEYAADGIRQYLYAGTREEIMVLLDKKRTYFDAYVSRPYIMYKDKRHAERIFCLLKKVWKERNILVVEGEYSRMGVKNDLFVGTNRIRRILCPERNAFDNYDEILEAVKSLAENDELVLVSLGPTATVLAYDLAKQGIQTLDIGQIDNEYEWFLRGAEDRIEIPGKRVAELDWCHEPLEAIADDEYEQQIVKRIGNCFRELGIKMGSKGYKQREEYD